MTNKLAKAFIFDMDGVIINSEPVWERYEQQFLPKLIGQKIYAQIKDQIIGNSVSGIYQLATDYGLKMDKAQFEQTYDEYATLVYQEAKITEGIEKLISNLALADFKLGLVSSSRQYWIDLVLKKLDYKNRFQLIMSLDSEGISPKPAPNGYLKAIKILGASPETTIILEDSKRGVQAAKASGSVTICLTKNLPPNYRPAGADYYAASVPELVDQTKELLQIC